jgi:hypothetical protein
VGVIRGDYRQPEAASRTKSRPPERPLGGDMDQIGGELRQMTPQPGRGGQRKMDFLVEGELDSGEIVDFHAWSWGNGRSVAGDDQEQVVAVAA